jgi:ComF family protein
MVHQASNLSKLIYKKLSNCLEFVQNGLYPSTCFICDKLGQSSLDLCHACQQELFSDEHACITCGIQLATDNSICGRCLKTTPHFDTVRTLYRYEGISQFLIQSLKFQKKHSAAKIMGTLMAAEFKHLEAKPDALIAVPLHTQRLKERGFNQSEQIAQHIHKALDIPLLPHALKRNINTASQASLSADERRKNIKGAFDYQIQTKFQRVAIIDDVVTTGSTANEIAKTLKKSGIKQVDIWAFARA